MVASEKKSLKVGKYVDTKHVSDAISNYKKERWAANSQRLGKEDSLSVWYSVEELEAFVASIKEQGGDGIKMYFGAYAADYQENPLYAGRQTVVMVATKRKETLKGSSDKDIYVHTAEGTSILAYNSGKLCPPFCNNDGGMGDVGISIVDKGTDGFVVI